MAEAPIPVLSKQQKKFVQIEVAKVRSAYFSLRAPSPEDFLLIYAAVARDLAQLDPASNPDPATIPNPLLRDICEETRNDMVKHTARRYALDGDIAALRADVKEGGGREGKPVRHALGSGGDARGVSSLMRG